jgi:hypothetical protein
VYAPNGVDREAVEVRLRLVRQELSRIGREDILRALMTLTNFDEVDFESISRLRCQSSQGRIPADDWVPPGIVGGSDEGLPG